MLKITSLHIKRLDFQPFLCFMAVLQIRYFFSDFPNFSIVFHHFPLIFALQTPFFTKANEGNLLVKSEKNGSKAEILSRKTMDFLANIVTYKHHSLSNYIFNVLKISIFIILNGVKVSKCQSVKLKRKSVI